MYFDETGLPWVMPSPNMPTLDSAIVYPGAVLFEGTMLSEGRGTTRPFELIGAPWIDGERLADGDERARPARRALPAGVLRADVPEARAGRPAAAASCTCSIAQAFQPVRAAVELIDEFRRQNPAAFAWREPPYEYEHDKRPIDILYGSDRLRTDDRRAATTSARWSRRGRADEEAFRRTRERT